MEQVTRATDHEYMWNMEKITDKSKYKAINQV